MVSHVALLRGMNVGGRRITNVELCGLFEALGFEDVGAFLASGNVVFSSKQSAATIRKRLETGLAAALDYDVPTFVRTAAQVRVIAGYEAFAGRRGRDKRGKAQVIAVLRKPSAAAAKRSIALASSDDWLEWVGTELHWSPAAGVSDSELDFAALAKIVGPTTVRTGNTIARLAKKFFS